jgi:hypothetical protein
MTWSNSSKALSLSSGGRDLKYFNNSSRKICPRKIEIAKPMPSHEFETSFSASANSLLSHSPAEPSDLHASFALEQP